MSVAEIQVEADLETFDDKDPWYSVAIDLIKRKPLGAAGAPDRPDHDHHGIDGGTDRSF